MEANWCVHVSSARLDSLPSNAALILLGIHQRCQSGIQRLFSTFATPELIYLRALCSVPSARGPLSLLPETAPFI